MTDVQVSNAKPLLVKLSMVAVWALALAVRVFFGWETRLFGFMSFGALFLDLFLITAPLVMWLCLRSYRVLRPPSLLVKLLVVSVQVCYLASHPFVEGGRAPTQGVASRIPSADPGAYLKNASLMSARSYLWRMEEVLLEQVAAIQAGKTPPASANFVHPIRVDSGRVYWPSSAWALSSYGLVYDPTGQIKLDKHAFGEQVVRVVHLRGPWFLCSFT